MFDGPEGSWIWPRDAHTHAHSHFARLVCAGLGVLAGMALMTGVVLVTAAGRPAGPALPSPGILTVVKLAGLCSVCTPGEPCNPATLYCLGFVNGVMDSRPQIGRLCLPHDYGIGDAAAIFTAWAASHADSKNMEASEGVERALAASFDCRRSRGGV